MPTPIQRRFNNQTVLLDSAATTPVLNVGAILTTENAVDKAVRFKSLAADEWKTAVPKATNPITYAWLEAYFGQELRPASAVVIRYDKTGGDANVGAALDDAVTKNAAFYSLCYSGTSDTDIADQKAVAAWVNSSEVKRQCVLLTNDPKAFDPAAATDIGAQCKTATLPRTTCIYHPTGTINGIVYTNQRPDAAALGRMLPTYPETGGVFEQWDYKQLSLASDAGLTSQQQTDLIAKGYNFVETFTNTAFTHLFKGRTCTGREIRVQWAADWFDTSVSASLANYAFRTPLMAYDDATFADVEAIYRSWLDSAVQKRVLTEYSITMPDPESIPASVRATGKCNISDLYVGTLNSAIDEWSNTGKWKIGGV
ncbi:MAG: DUF3383 family protein [Aeromonadaceae bacterium]